MGESEMSLLALLDLDPLSHAHADNTHCVHTQGREVPSRKV